jgi:uncharacterized protein YdcH (DUF465 family)
LFIIFSQISVLFKCIHFKGVAMFSAIGRFFGSFGIVKALTGWITPIIIMSIVVAILTMGYFVNKQFNEFKADLVTQGKKQAEFDKLKEATDKLSNEIKLLKASNQVTIDETQKLRQDLNNVQEAAKIRQVTVKKKVDALRLDKTMDPLTKEREISRVYADSLRDSQCRILPELCQSAQPKAEAVEESIIDKPIIRPFKRLFKPKNKPVPDAKVSFKAMDNHAVQVNAQLPTTLKPLEEIVYISSQQQEAFEVVISSLSVN